MTVNRTPAAHEDPWLDVLRGYVSQAVESLAQGGVAVEGSWLDPRNPRDATIVFAGPDSMKRALVWDEVTGWRHGIFQSGHQGERTALSSVSNLGGGVLLSGPELVGRVLAGASEPRREYRSVTDVRDGLDDALREYK